MAKLIAARTSQNLQEAEFTFNFSDWVVDKLDGTKKTLGSTVANSADPSETALTGPVANTVVFDAINLPEGAVVVGGELVVETAGAGPTAYTLTLGDSVSATRYLASTSLLSAARTALTLTGYRATENLRATLAYTVANATALKATVRVLFVLPGKANEAIPN